MPQDGPPIPELEEVAAAAIAEASIAAQGLLDEDSNSDGNPWHKEAISPPWNTEPFRVSSGAQNTLLRGGLLLLNILELSEVLLEHRAPRDQVQRSEVPSQ